MPKDSVRAEEEIPNLSLVKNKESDEETSRRESLHFDIRKNCMQKKAREYAGLFAELLFYRKG